MASAAWAVAASWAVRTGPQHARFRYDLTGSCDPLAKTGSYTLCTNQPEFWDGPRTGQPARWTCAWCSTTSFINIQAERRKPAEPQPLTTA